MVRDTHPWAVLINKEQTHVVSRKTADGKKLQGPGRQWMFIVQVRRLWGVETKKSIPKKNIRAKEEGVDVNWEEGDRAGQDGHGAAFTVLQICSCPWPGICLPGVAKSGPLTLEIQDRLLEFLSPDGPHGVGGSFELQ